MTLGHKVMHNFGIHQNAYLYWLGVGTLAGYIILFNTLYTLALTYLNRKLPAPFSFVELSLVEFFFNDLVRIEDDVSA